MPQMVRLKRITSESDHHLCCSFLAPRLESGPREAPAVIASKQPQKCVIERRKRLAMSHDISGRMTAAEYSSSMVGIGRKDAALALPCSGRGTAAPHQKDIYSLMVICEVLLRLTVTFRQKGIFNGKAYVTTTLTAFPILLHAFPFRSVVVHCVSQSVVENAPVPGLTTLALHQVAVTVRLLELMPG